MGSKPSLQAWDEHCAGKQESGACLPACQLSVERHLWWLLTFSFKAGNSPLSCPWKREQAASGSLRFSVHRCELGKRHVIAKAFGLSAAVSRTRPRDQRFPGEVSLSGRKFPTQEVSWAQHTLHTALRALRAGVLSSPICSVPHTPQALAETQWHLHRETFPASRLSPHLH